MYKERRCNGYSVVLEIRRTMDRILPDELFFSSLDFSEISEGSRVNCIGKFPKGERLNRLRKFTSQGTCSHIHSEVFLGNLRCFWDSVLRDVMLAWLQQAKRGLEFPAFSKSSVKVTSIAKTLLLICIPSLSLHLSVKQMYHPLCIKQAYFLTSHRSKVNIYDTTVPRII